MRPRVLSVGLLGFTLAFTGSAAALAQGATRLPDETRAERQTQDINRNLQQQLQIQQQNQNFQWQLDNQRMRQQIDTPRIGGGSPTCPAGSVGC